MKSIPFQPIAMFEYKNQDYFDYYCSNQTDFKLIEPFVRPNEKGKDNLYIGTIEAIGTVHPLKICVEIPTTFPHNKLLFWTTSLSNYPHLIYNGTRKQSWFCLNTPFAETPEEQLNHEFNRLREWIKRQMRNDLPTEIEDLNFAQDLRRVNAYSWENIDEMNEYSSEAMLTFVGDFANKLSYFKNKEGYFSCIRNRNNRFFVFDKLKSATYKLPYIIVDKAPNNFNNFLDLKKFFLWEDSICERLLPDFDINKRYKISSFEKLNHLSDNDLPEEEALSILNEAILKLVIPKEHKEIFNNKINSIKNEIKKKHKYEGINSTINTIPTIEEENEIDYYLQHYPYELACFALGIRLENDTVLWSILITNRNSAKYKETEYNIGLRSITIQELQSHFLDHELAQSITYNDYFGRGQFSPNLTEKKIAIVGLGAIGSMLAESLARSGVKEFGLWDNDIVEPGNICRSTYDINDLGNCKIRALESRLKAINPFCNIEVRGYWGEYSCLGHKSVYIDGEFYGNINYNSQKTALNQLDEYDIVIDCTASNELLHFLSYALEDKELISLCITNHANNLLCITNNDGNTYELRKSYLSKIEQDTENFFAEGTGCYSPTFLATNSDIATLTNLAVREMNLAAKEGHKLHSTIWSYTSRGVVADKLIRYQLINSDISLSISSETLMDGEDIRNTDSISLGYMLGSYSSDGKHITLTHFIEANNAKQKLENAFNVSNGIIDYIGDYYYSGKENDTYNEEILDILEAKANDISINTNNPLLAIRNPDRSISFFLYINEALHTFIPIED